MAQCKLKSNKLSLTLESIPTKLKEDQFVSNFLVNIESDPKWIGSWLIYYLFILLLFKKYNHNTSIYINNFNVYTMKIILKYKIENYSNSILESPTKIGRPFYMEPSTLSYVEFIIDKISNDCEILIIPLHINVINNILNTDGTYTEYPVTHKNVIIYKKCLNAFEHFEPYGDHFQTREIDLDIRRCLKMLISYINRKSHKNIKFNSNSKTSLTRNTTIPNSSYNYPAAGPQTLEFWASEYTDFERDQGYCVAWSLLFIELSLKYPSMSIKQINQKVMEEVVEAITIHEKIPNPSKAINFSKRYLYLARNYSYYIIAQIELNYNFLFDKFVSENTNNLVSQVSQIYHDTEYRRYLIIINVLYSIESICIHFLINYEQYLQIIRHRYEMSHGEKPNKKYLIKPIIELKYEDFTDESEFNELLVMNLLTKLIENNKRKPSFYTLNVHKKSSKKRSNNKTLKRGSRFQLLSNNSPN
jgi:hypothetical protein